MKLATTTADFDSFCKSYTECLERIRTAGFRYVDLSLYTVSEHKSLLVSDDWHATVDSLRADADRLGLDFVQAHAPGGNPLKEETLDDLVTVTNRTVEICGALGIKNVVVHSGWAPGVGKDEYFERNRAFYRRLFPAMEKCGVNVLTENTTHANMGENYAFFSGADMKAFIEYVDHPLFHACWDTGHGNIEGDQYDQLVTLGKDLYAIHLNDNRGSQDEHLIPFMGTANMDDIMCGLLDGGYEGYFTFEATDTLRPYRCWLGNRRKFVREHRLREPDAEMQQDLEALMYRVGKHILEAYGCFEA